MTKRMNDSLMQTYSSLEVTQALNQMHPFKSLGLDGMSLVFYQKFWHVVSQDIIKFLEFLNNGLLNKNLNFTYVVLIPKCQCLSNITQFRLVSLCNVVYGLAFKVITN